MPDGPKHNRDKGYGRAAPAAGLNEVDAAMTTRRSGVNPIVSSQ